MLHFRLDDDHRMKQEKMTECVPILRSGEPKNLFHSPAKAQYEVGDVVSCFADAYPPPFYGWQNWITNEIINSQVGTISSQSSNNIVDQHRIVQVMIGRLWFTTYYCIQ